MRNVFQKGRPPKFKLGIQTEHKDPHQLQAQWPPRLKVKVARSRDASNRCWPIRRERNVLETLKIGRKIPTPCAIRRTCFKVKRQTSRSPGRIMLRPEVRNIVRTERPTNLKLGTQMDWDDPDHRQAPWRTLPERILQAKYLSYIYFFAYAWYCYSQV